MKITTISDTHGMHHEITQPKGGDLIICAGDVTPNGKENDVEEFLRWFSDQDYKYKVLVAGNHDWHFESQGDRYYVERCEDYGIKYLNDSEVKIEGLKVWGSPITPAFNNWAFNRARSPVDPQATPQMTTIHEHWDKIPEDVDILITHGPPQGILDVADRGFLVNAQSVGCSYLRYVVERIKPKLHVFGHIHEQRGVHIENVDGVPIVFVNSACLDHMYSPYEEEQFMFDWSKVIIGDSYGFDF